MNNNSLNKIIDLYGGSNDSIDNSKEYTESLLEKYNKNEKISLTIKINNLKTLLVDETKNDKNNYSLKNLKKII